MILVENLFQNFKITGLIIIIKLGTDYINFICPSSDSKSSDPVGNIKGIIDQCFIREFSTKVKDLKTYDMLVDSVMHRIQKKALEKEFEFK